jgi:hypothetical protein
MSLFPVIIILPHSPFVCKNVADAQPAQRSALTKLGLPNEVY